MLVPLFAEERTQFVLANMETGQGEEFNNLFSFQVQGDFQLGKNDIVIQSCLRFRLSPLSFSSSFVYEAIQEVASTSALMVVFDKSNHSNMLYTNPKHDITKRVTEKMNEQSK